MKSTNAGHRFVSDTLSDGRRFRILCVVDDFSRECLATVVDTSLGGVRVVREPRKAAHDRTSATGRRWLAIMGQNSQWCDPALGSRRDRLALRQAGQARAKRLHQSFNSKLRDRCRNEYVFGNLAEARAIIEGRGGTTTTTCVRTRV